MSRELQDRWPGRLAAVASLIRPRSRVIDLGAGARGLAAVLPPGCRYTAAEPEPRADELAFDMNAGIWPVGRWDVATMIGVLEAADDLVAVFDGLARLAPLALVTSDNVVLPWRDVAAAARLAGWIARRTEWSDELVGTQTIWQLWLR